jgi:hypothetical protein
MDLGYTSLGKISYDILPGDTEGFENLQKYQREVGMNAFKFIPFDREFTNRLISDIKTSCPDWDYLGVHKETIKPQYALVIRNMLEDKPFQELNFNIQKGVKQIRLSCVRGFDEYMFVTFYYSIFKKEPNRQYYTSYEDTSKGIIIWDAYICDMNYEDSFQNLLKEISSRFSSVSIS